MNEIRRLTMEANNLMDATDERDVIQISQVDRERIEQEVAQFRKMLERQYAMAYLQGQIDCANETSKRIAA